MLETGSEKQSPSSLSLPKDREEASQESSIPTPSLCFRPCSWFPASCFGFLTLETASYLGSEQENRAENTNLTFLLYLRSLILASLWVPRH